MAGTITKLEIQKRNKDRVNVYLDDEYAFAVTVTVALELQKGQFIDDAEIAQFKSNDDHHKAYDRALHFLGFRARSRAEMERYLRQKKYSEDVVAATVQRLVDEQYLDDRAFAQSWVENRERLKPISSRALRYELRQKGVSESAIESALHDLDEDDAAWRALESKLWQWQQLDEDSFKQKAGAFLSRRGFGYEVAMETVVRAWHTINSDGDEV